MDDDFDFDADVDSFLDAGIGEIERRSDLQRDVAFAATVEFQATDRSSVLHQYMSNRRVNAMSALAELFMVEPEDAIRVGQLQAEIREYLNVRGWVAQIVETGDNADMIMRGEASGQEADETDTAVRAASRRNARARRRH